MGTHSSRYFAIYKSFFSDFVFYDTEGPVRRGKEHHVPVAAEVTEGQQKEER